MTEEQQKEIALAIVGRIYTVLHPILPDLIHRLDAPEEGKPHWTLALHVALADQGNLTVELEGKLPMPDEKLDTAMVITTLNTQGELPLGTPAIAEPEEQPPTVDGRPALAPPTFHGETSPGSTVLADGEEGQLPPDLGKRDVTDDDNYNPVGVNAGTVEETS
jgi:hypothetical protein